MSDTKSVQVGPGFGGSLFLVFLVLKLTDVIDWSWWWVTAPLWIPLGIVAAIAVVGLSLVGISNLLESQEDKNIRKARQALKNYSKNL